MRKLKIIFIRGGLVLLSLVVMFLAFVFIEDATYPNPKTEQRIGENKRAIILTWEHEEQNVFWEKYKQDIYPTLRNLFEKGLIKNVFPLAHKPLSHPDKAGKWTHCVILMLPGRKNYDDAIHTEIFASIRKSPLKEHLRSLDLMRIQPGLDMLYPLKNGIEKEPKLNQTIEYIFSQPEAREQYYKDQYQFSGPAMRDLYNRDKAGRFVGFELEKRVYGAQDMPQWDVIHFIGFTSWQEIKAIPFFSSTWNKHAARVYGEGMTFDKKVAEWETIRINIKSAATQHFSSTIPQKTPTNASE